MQQRSLRRQISLRAAGAAAVPPVLRENIAYGLPGATDEQVVVLPAGLTRWTSSVAARRFRHAGRRARDQAVGGQRRRIAITGAILKDAHILVLDGRPVPWTAR